MLEAGQRIDRYVVQRLLGRGGFAEVWAVEHAVLGTPRAVKVLWTDQVILQESLVEEGRVQARLAHPNILPVLDVFVHHDAPVLVMPLVEDATLDTVLQQGAVEPGTAAALMRGVLDAVAFAHSHGVAHRDLKPANVLLELRHGSVAPRVADFGLAKLLTGPGAPAHSRGPFVGTPAYAAPEQLENAGGVDHRADYWSLGILLYELLTGWRPFEVTSLQDLYRRQRQRVFQPLLDREPGLDPDWSSLVDLLMDPDPDQRLSDPAEFRKTLDLLSPAATPDPLGADGVIANLLWTARSSPRGSAAPTEDMAAAAMAHVPSPLDAYVGRTLEHEQLELALRTPGVITITGPAGVGKSRFALEAARRQLHHGPDSARHADLAEATDIDSLLAAVAGALGVPVVVDDPVLHLAWVMQARAPLLLILDNADRVVEPLRDLLLGLPLDEDDIQILVTSRQPLHMAGERLVHLDVLGLPPTDTLRDVEKSAAVQLFVARIQQHRPGISVNARNAAALAKLVRRLDGLPLALELAAAGPAAHSAGPVDLYGILRKLSNELDVMGLTSQAGDEENALRAALDGSWAQLGTEERHLLACMSVFEGGATLAAIRSVAGRSDARATEDQLATLVDRSLVRRVTNPGGTPRFGLLRSVHTYGQERLAELPKAVRRTIERAHATWFSRFGRAHELAALRVRGGTVRRMALRVEHDNLLVGLRRAIRWGDTDQVACLALAAWAVAEHAGPYQAAVRWLREARSAGSGPRDADLCLAEGDALRLSGRRDASNRSYQAGLRRAREAGDPWATGMCLDRLGRNHMAQGRLDQADPLLAEARAEIQRSGDASRIAEITDDIGWLRLQQDRPSEAEVLFSDALSRFERLGDRGSEGVCTQHLALAALAQGDLGRTDDLLQDALSTHRGTGHTRFEAFCLSDLGEVAAREARWPDAVALQTQAAATHREVGDRHGEALALFRLGKAAAAMQQPDAGTTLEAAWELATSAGDAPLEAAIEEALRRL